jgi:hypothetical protein
MLAISRSNRWRGRVALLVILVLTCPAIADPPVSLAPTNPPPVFPGGAPAANSPQIAAPYAPGFWLSVGAKSDSEPPPPSMMPFNPPGLEAPTEVVTDGQPGWNGSSRYHQEARPLWENFSLLAGLDGAKGPEDLGIGGNFGYRIAVQTGFPLFESWGIGMQVGTAFNYQRTTSRLMPLIEGVSERTQSFTTIGVFQRMESGWSWGVVYDFLYESYYVDMALGQWRGRVGYAFSPCNEIGAWCTVRSLYDRFTGGNVPDFDLKPIDQFNLYWRHVWPTNVVTRIWIGLADEHGRSILFDPSTPPVHHPVVFGADVFVPLSANWALFGEANFITPSSTGTVAALFGLVFYPAGTAGDAFHNRFAPLLPTANNPTFGVNMLP